MHQMECVQSVKIDFSKCVKTCSGLVIASFAKSRDVHLNNLMSNAISDYNNFTKWRGFPQELKGIS